MDANLVIINLLIGGLGSQACESASFFQDPKQSDLKKFGVAFGLCIAASLLVTLLSLDALPAGYIAWRTLLETIVVTATGSQAFHLAALKWFPGAETPSVSMTTKTTANGETTMTKFEATGASAALPPAA